LQRVVGQIVQKEKRVVTVADIAQRKQKAAGRTSGLQVAD
jgi:hypothetical protein